MSRRKGVRKNLSNMGQREEGSKLFSFNDCTYYN